MLLLFLLPSFLRLEDLLYAIVLYCGTVAYISELHALLFSFLQDLKTFSVFQDVGS